MDPRPRSELTERGLTLAGGREVDFFIAEIHYWRLPRSAWGACLAAVKDLGFEIASTAVPWSVHETAAGRYDWSGARDLPGFLDEVERAGLLCVLQPGPTIDAELTHGGFPERIVRDRAMQAVSGRGTPMWFPAPPHMFPLPSYAAQAFRAAAGAWLAEVGRVVAPRLVPGGPVAAIRLDAGFHDVFRAGAHDGDYHPDAIAWWREETGEERDPPRVLDAALSARWVAFKEVYAERARAWIRRALDDAGLGDIAHHHDGPPPLATDYAAVRARALSLAGVRVAVGGPPWLPPMSAEAEAEVTRGLLAGGARALSFAMVVDRERWHGAAISETGALRPPADFLRTLVAALRAIEWTSLRRRAPVALVVSRAEARHANATSAADPLSPALTELLRLGPGGAAELARDRSPALHRRWMDAVAMALDEAGIGYDRVDEDAPAPRFESRRLVVAPTLARVDRRLWQRLHELAARGVRVVIGPERPSRDEFDGALGDDAALPRRVGLLRPASLEDIAGLARDLAQATGETAPAFRSASRFHLSVFDDRHGDVQALTLGNPVAEKRTAELTVPAGTCLVDPFTGERWREADGVVRILLGASAVRLLTIAPT